MIGWKRLYPKPAGSLPGGIVTQWGVALITVLILIFVALWLASGGTEQAGIDSIGGEVTGPARSFAGQMAAQVEAEALRAETRRAAADRTLQAEQRQEAREVATGAIGGGQVTMDEALLLAGSSPETGRAYTQQEFELRERLRLEALERRSRSLRSSPVAQTYRQFDRAGSSGAVGAEPGPVEAIRAEGAAALSQALGTFEGVSSVPTEFIGVGLSWKNDFTGVAGELAGAVEQLGESGTSFTDAWRDRLTASNTISESDFLSLYAGQSPEVGAAASRVYLAAAEAGDKKLVMAHAQSDATKNLMVAAKEAVSSYEGLRSNTNTSNTALQQAMVAGTVTQGNLTAAMAQLMVYQASQESAREYEQEIARREELARFVEAEREAQITFDAQQAGIAARVDSMREGLLFRVPALYGGPGQ